MRILVIDNADSFTYNLVDYLTALNDGVAPDVVAATASTEPDFAAYHAIVISPGPGTPLNAADVGLSAAALAAGRPVLGVCLGHQLIAAHFGGRVTRAPRPVHGYPAEVTHRATGLFEGLPQPVEVVRYHSLVVDKLPDTVAATAWTTDGLIMGLAHRDLPLYGVQFHPESVGADVASGRRILANFLALARSWWEEQAPEILDVPARSDTGIDAATAEALFLGLYGDDERALWLDDSTATTNSYLASPSRYADLPEEPAAVPHLADGPDLQLGWVGYLGYEAWDTHGTAEHRLPSSRFARIEQLVCLDHAGHRVRLLARRGDPWLAHTAARVRAILADPQQATPQATPSSATPPAPHITARASRADYLAAIADTQELIAAGETYELCLTNELRAATRLDPVACYLRLRRTHPSTTSGLLRFPSFPGSRGFALASTSPETFLTITPAGRITSRPIKGTRPRGATPTADRALAAELAGGAKERAENLMIVDLVRHDLTHFAVPGTISVPRAFEVETYASVHQLVSTVTAQLRPGTRVLDAVRAAFPGGSMTGAPKIRTMELIARLEGAPRGPYAGAFGYFSDSGAADLAMTIRTLVIEPDLVTYGTGGAILADSDPAAEYEETLTKARPFRDALDRVGTVDTVGTVDADA